MEAALTALIWERARRRCEYCQMPQQYDTLTFEIDHVIPVKHGGRTTADNLALACFYCNNRKGPNLSGIDPKTAKIVPLFNPRVQKWGRHFAWNAAWIAGKTKTGRATVVVLEMNLSLRVQLRQALLETNLFPSKESMNGSSDPLP
jgi:hypothetical protein